MPKRRCAALCHHALLDADLGIMCVGTRRQSELPDRHTTRWAPTVKDHYPIPLPLHGPQKNESPISTRPNVADVAPQPRKNSHPTTGRSYRQPRSLSKKRFHATNSRAAARRRIKQPENSVERLTVGMVVAAPIQRRQLKTTRDCNRPDGV